MKAMRALDLVGDPRVARPSAEVATNSWFQAWTRARSAKPPLVNARRRLSVADGLLVGGDEPPGVGAPRVGVEGLVVDHVAAEALERDPVDLLELARTGAWRTAPRCGRP